MHWRRLLSSRAVDKLQRAESIDVKAVDLRSDDEARTVLVESAVRNFLSLFLLLFNFHTFLINHFFTFV